MERSDVRTSDSLELPRLTSGQRRILAALTAEWVTARELVGDADIATQTALESAAGRANELVKFGLAERSSGHRNPVWRQSAVLRNLVK